jgi:hypothetical protein
MKVQIGDKIYNSKDQPILLTLSRDEIIDMLNNNEAKAILIYPDNWLSEDIRDYCRQFYNQGEFNLKEI